jgi:hypothetical protein
MAFSNPNEGKVVISRITRMDSRCPGFLSRTTDQIIRETYVLGGIRGDDGERHFFAMTEMEYDSSRNEGGLGVAHSFEDAEKMAYDYIRQQTEEVMKVHYPNHTLDDKVNL